MCLLLILACGVRHLCVSDCEGSKQTKTMLFNEMQRNKPLYNGGRRTVPRFEGNCMAHGNACNMKFSCIL